MRIKAYLCGGERPVSEYPLGLGYLKSNVAPNMEIVPDRAGLEGADLILLSSNAWGLREAVEILEGASVPVIIGGQGTLWEPLQEFNFWHIVIGEGELALAAILRGAEPPKAIYTRVIENIDTLKFPDRGKCGKTIPILTSRGCPFSCTFCSSTKFWQTARYHSAEYVMNDVRNALSKYPRAKVIYALDDLFVGNLARFDEICRRWLDAGLHKRVGLMGFVRSDMLTRELADKMKRMNFLTVRFGAESGSDRILEILGKRETVADHQRAIDICHDVGLRATASFMAGVPGETEEDADLTRAFLKRNAGKLSIAGNYRYVSLPGTDLYDGTDPLTADMRTRP